ncbi:MAG: hypothetical protein ACO1N0_07645 [Fluviicola sp.]
MKHLNLLLALSISTVFCSCTITKRHFGAGYHVEWNRKMKSASHKEESPKPEEAEPNLVSNDITEPDSVGTKQFITEVPDVLAEAAVYFPVTVTQEEPIVNSNTFDEPVQSEESLLVNRQVETLESTMDEEEQETEVPRRIMHPLMWGIWTAWSIAIACMFFVTFYAEALIGVAAGFIIAMIFAIIVIHGLRKHREKYRFKGLSYPFAILAIVFGAISVAGVALFLLFSLV